jgi:hypothetical protein
MMMTAMLAVAHALMAAVSFAPAVAQPLADTGAVPSTVALVETYADGRSNFELVSARPAKMWTPNLPRVEGYRPPDGALPVFAVQIARVLAGRDIKATVSVLLGSSSGQEVHLADVLITPGSRIVVDALTTFGIEPITLSMATVAPLTPYFPTVVSVTPLIEIANVELLNAPYPGYRITLRNLSTKGASNAHVQSYRGEEKALSALRRDDTGRPVMMPGATYTFDLNLTSGAADTVTAPGTWSPRPLDVVEIDAVRWDDGSYDGAPPYPQVDPVIEGDAGLRVQLQRIVEALRETLKTPGSGNDRLAALRSRIDALPGAEPDQLAGAQRAMRATKAAALADIGRFESDGSAVDGSSAVTDWLAYTLKRYEAWLKRVSPG